MADSQYILVDSYGTPFDVFTSEPVAVAALRRLVDDDPTAADDCFVAVLDEAGKRIRTLAGRLEPTDGHFKVASSTCARDVARQTC